MHTRHCFVVVMALGLAACQTTAPAQVATPAAAPASVAPAPDLPPANTPSDASAVLDHRGGHGSILLQQLSLQLDQGQASCLQIDAKGERRTGLVALEAAEQMALQADVKQLLQTPPRQLQRQALVHDLGTMTLTLRDEGRELSVVADKAVRLDMSADALLTQLAALRSRCLGGAPVFSDLYIARHGQTEWNRLGRWQGDPDINALGYEHRVGLYLALRDVPVDYVLASTRLRARRTAELTARMLGRELQLDDDLRELEGGLFEGLCIATIETGDLPKDFASCRPGGAADADHPTTAFLRQEYLRYREDRLRNRPAAGGESYLDGRARIRRFLQRHRELLSTGTGLVVAHGGTNRVLLSELMGWPLAHGIRVRQHNDWIFRVQQQVDGTPKLSLYSAGQWLACSGAPDAEGRLDCVDQAEAQKR